MPADVGRLSTGSTKNRLQNIGDEQENFLEKSHNTILERIDLISLAFLNCLVLQYRMEFCYQARFKSYSLPVHGLPRGCKNANVTRTNLKHRCCKMARLHDRHISTKCNTLKVDVFAPFLRPLPELP